MKRNAKIIQCLAGVHNFIVTKEGTEFLSMNSVDDAQEMEMNANAEREYHSETDSESDNDEPPEKTNETHCNK